MEQEITQEATDQKKEEIKKDIQSNRVVLYMKGNKMAPMCGFSAQVVQILLNLGVDFETRDILQDEILRSTIKDFSDWPTLPQLYIDGEFVGGCDIISELYENGELKTLLKVS
ncbi:Grx4 family monothiol glutaredoxin [Candidatus Marinamargulisbacteria bacterium SCGC AAA071-K20]|nr:Grx4 family monothiol glutaredoxin [Candidatus Marinamargulisbacteria bacterium SCGC AAA071-K20]